MVTISPVPGGIVTEPLTDVWELWLERAAFPSGLLPNPPPPSVGCSEKPDSAFPLYVPQAAPDSLLMLTGLGVLSSVFCDGVVKVLVVRTTPLTAAEAKWFAVLVGLTVFEAVEEGMAFAAGLAQGSEAGSPPSESCLGLRGVREICWGDGGDGGGCVMG